MYIPQNLVVKENNDLYSWMGIHQSSTSSNIKKKVVEKYYKSKALNSCVSFLQFLPKKLHYERFTILVHKKL